MRFKTIMETKDKHNHKLPNNNMLIMVMVYILNLMFSFMLPFAIGFYLCETNNPLLFLALFIFLFVEISLEYKGNTVKLKILRNI